MGLIEGVIRALLYLCALAICFFLVIWVLGVLGIVIPATILTILKVMFVLIAILVLVRMFMPYWSGPWFPPRA